MSLLIGTTRCDVHSTGVGAPSRLRLPTPSAEEPPAARLSVPICSALSGVTRGATAAGLVPAPARPSSTGSSGSLRSPAANVNFIYTDDGAETISELAPISEVERGREIMSAHANKFADRDASGAPILYPMLQSLGVDTVVVVGAWTDFCVLATVIAAVDTWGFDTVVPTDAIASAMAISDDTAHSGLDIINLFALTRRTHEVLDFMKTRPELVVPPLTEDDAYNAAEAERSAPFFRSGAHRAAFRRDSAH